MAVVQLEMEPASLGKQSGTEVPRERGRGTGSQSGGHSRRQGVRSTEGALHPQMSLYISHERR